MRPLRMLFPDLDLLAQAFFALHAPMAAAKREAGPERGARESERQDGVSRGGHLTAYGDPHGVLAESKAGLDEVVRE